MMTPTKAIGATFLGTVLSFIIALTTIPTLTHAQPYYQQLPTAPTPLSIPTPFRLSYTLGSLPVNTITNFIPAEFGNSIVGDPLNNYIWRTNQVVVPFPDPTGCGWYADPPGFGKNVNLTAATAVGYQSNPAVLSTYYNSKIALVARTSNCDVSVQAKQAQDAGASAIILYSCNPSSLTALCDSSAPIYMTAKGLPLSITAISIDYRTGNLFNSILSVRTAFGDPASPITIELPGTTNISSSDSLALKALVNSISIFPANDLNGGTARYLSDIVASPLVDPCVNRVRGIWCWGSPGRLAMININYGVSGTLPLNSIGLMDQLFVLNLASTNQPLKWSGTLPIDITGLTNLRTLNLDDNLFTDLTSALSSLTSLGSLSFQNNYLTTLPDVIANLQYLQYLNGRNNSIANFPIGLNNMASLTYLDLSDNKIVFDVTLLNFAGHASLRVVNLQENWFQGQLWPSTFDQMKMISIVDMSSNILTGPLPNFNASTTVTRIDFSYNMIVNVTGEIMNPGLSGGIPSNWSSLLSLNKLYLANNSLTNPITPLSACASLQYVDLSYNQITLGSDATSGVGTFLHHSFPNGIKVINLGHNLLSGPFPAGALTQKTAMMKLLLGGNQITSLPSMDLFTFSPYLEVIDLSNNTITGTLPITYPTDNFQQLRFEGNPNLVSPIANSLPDWLVQNTFISYVKRSVNDVYVCPSSFVGKYFPFTVTLDPQAYAYSLCYCERGFYGTPPGCQSVPISIAYPPTTFLSNGTVDTDIGLAGPQFSDTIFGNARYQAGIDTIWVIAQTNTTSTGTQSHSSFVQMAYGQPTMEMEPTTASHVSRDLAIVPVASLGPVLTIYITFVLNRAVFNVSSDVIEVYEGDSNLDGELIASFKGSDPDPVNQYGLNLPPGVIVVFASQASVNFRSKAVGGWHFNASYTLSYNCPTGFTATTSALNHPDVTQTCTPYLPTYSPPVSYQGVTIAIAVLSMLAVCIVAILAYNHRNKTIMKSTGASYVVLLSFFNWFLALGAIFYALQASDHEAICHLRPWFTGIGIVGVLACLLTKANQLQLLIAQKLAAGRRGTEANLNKVAESQVESPFSVGKVLLYVFLQFVIVVIYSGASNSAKTGRELVVGSGATTGGYMLWQCRSFMQPSSSAGVFFIFWLTVQLAYVFWLIFRLHLSIRTLRFTESSHIGNALFAIFTFGVLAVPIQFVINDDPSALVLFRGITQCLTAVLVSFCIFLPKLSLIFRGRGDEKLEIGVIAMVSLSSPKPKPQLGGAKGSLAGGKMSFAGAAKAVIANQHQQQPQQNAAQPSNGTFQRQPSQGSIPIRPAPGAIGASSSGAASPIASSESGLASPSQHHYSANPTSDLHPFPGPEPVAFMPGLHPIFTQDPNGLPPPPANHTPLIIPSGVYLTELPAVPENRGEIQFPPVTQNDQLRIDPLASWPPVMTYAACIPPTPFKPTPGGIPQGPIPVAANATPAAYDPFAGLPSGGGLTGSAGYPLTSFVGGPSASGEAQLYINPTSLVWGKTTIPPPEYIKELEQQNMILWSTQKQLAKILMDEESQKWLKLLQVSLMTVLKLNPVQQLTTKNISAQFTDEDVQRETEVFKRGSTALTAKEFVHNMERQNRLLWETQALVNSIFTNPDTEKWAKKSQTAITTILNLNRIEKLVMKSRDPASGPDEQPNANPYANPAMKELLLPSGAVDEAMAQVGEGIGSRRSAATAPAENKYDDSGSAVAGANITTSSRRVPGSRRPARTLAAARAAGLNAGGANDRGSLSMAAAQAQISAESSNASDPLRQIEQGNLNSSADMDRLTQTIAEANISATPRGRPDPIQEYHEGQSYQAAAAPATNSEQVYVYVQEDEHQQHQQQQFQLHDDQHQQQQPYQDDQSQPPQPYYDPQYDQQHQQGYDQQGYDQQGYDQQQQPQDGGYDQQYDQQQQPLYDPQQSSYDDQQQGYDQQQQQQPYDGQGYDQQQQPYDSQQQGYDQQQPYDNQQQPYDDQQQQYQSDQYQQDYQQQDYQQHPDQQPYVDQQAYPGSVTESYDASGQQGYSDPYQSQQQPPPTSDYYPQEEKENLIAPLPTQSSSVELPPPRARRVSSLALRQTAVSSSTSDEKQQSSDSAPTIPSSRPAPRARIITGGAKRVTSGGSTADAILAVSHR